MLGKCSPLVTKLASAADEIEENVPEATAGCWKRFRQWFHCFCVVTFDLELGQTIEVIYPGDATLSAQERSDLCYAAFPDSNSSAPSTYGHSPLRNMNHTGLNPGSDSSDSMHHFRIRRASFNEQNNVSKLEEIVPASLWPDPRFFHGFSFFRRQRDPMLPRGYFQKSIVLVSVLPLVTLFQRVLYEVALAFFTCGETAIETVCFQIDRHWPPPTKVGCPLSLPLFGLHFHYTIPDIRNSDGHGFLSKVEHLQLTTNGTTSKCENFFLIDNDERYNSQPDELTEEFEFVDHCNNNDNSNSLNNLCDRRMIVSSEIKADHHFNDVIWLLLPHLQLIWELVLLGEPLLVLTPTASLSSSLVNALITLINPLRYYGDYRPFFSIHDSDFTELSARQNCCVNNFVLGVTNPFFLKAFAHWPHILKIGHHCFNNNNNKNNTQQRHNDSASSEGPPETTPKATIAAKGNGREATVSFFNGRWEVGRVLRNAKTIKRLSGHAQLDNQAMGGFLSTHRQFLSDDKLLAQKLLKRPGDSASQRHTLERHFMELTQSFINPLERYIASLLPLRRHLCPFQPVPSMRPFSLDQFLTKLQHFGHPGVRGDWQGLYRQFVTRSPNFIGWLQQRRKHIEKQLKEEYLELLCSANLSSEVLCHRNQVEIVDLVLKFRDHLAEVEMKHRGGSEQRENWSFSTTPMKQQRVLIRQRAQLQQQLNCLLGLVDDELKNLLMSNNTLRRAVSENAADDPIVP
ncbi:hypothetical protein niasHT_019947 [Heterodera trifolii]|uniref:UDENN domain-containing protein n=1 Tax=Heterodera trifolii TaxID=157864 RepID=A0ABD2L8N5_9BILA